jgi:hypothetical protein
MIKSNHRNSSEVEYRHTAIFIRNGQINEVKYSNTAKKKNWIAINTIRRPSKYAKSTFKYGINCEK